MRAAQITAFGGPEVFSVTDVPTPEVAPGEVLVRLRAAGLNRADIVIREGRFPEAPPPPMTLGVEGAGEVVEIGDGVDGFLPGDRVVINPMKFCGHCERCLRGQDSECLSLQVVGEHFDGTYAEFISLPARLLIPAPERLGFEQLAVGVVPYMTAWHMLKTRGQVAAGETVLVVGAGSGVAGAAIQVAKALGATVIATTSSARKEEQARALGADEVVNYRTRPDFDVAVKELTGGRGADLVHDSVGAATLQKSIDAAAHGGRLVGMGSHTGRSVELDLWSIYRREITVLGCHTSNRAEIAEFLPLLADGSITPVIDSVYPLESAVEAQARLDAPERFGKVVLSIG
ncbi:zinc-binding dehydrogenase [Nakamurella sp. YIM 132087]|uniref:Zinc-binding dehydrogenase n=1 Tax=Nakamurella alba TaxID=2665158 RepID=A0A7K1FTQ4_9ACTN|nr:zinc-binding dehydrogenase [Nakamurella alba]MTD16184.1 zinc-binding dehydrogenase [Nakamurella alba]